MELHFPSYYNQFHCIAGACPDSCCKEWAVDVDDESAAYYRALPGDLGDRLRQVLQDTEDGTVMTIVDGRCPMWRQDGLCQIQAQLGHDALCKTCREFPRLRHDYGSFVELGLELSCPEAARLILTSSNTQWVQEQRAGSETPEYDTDVMACLLDSRRQALALLQDTAYPLPHRLAILLLYGQQVQEQIDSGASAVLDPNALLATAHIYAGNGCVTSLFSFFKGLEILTDQWQLRLECTPVNAPWTCHFSALARYLTERYWLQSVSDLDLYGRVKLIVAACLLVNRLGGDPIQTAQLFSKEIENDPDNIIAILDGSYKSAALSDENLLGLLLSRS